jgi:hypothetical protein
MKQKLLAVDKIYSTYTKNFNELKKKKTKIATEVIGPIKH